MDAVVFVAVLAAAACHAAWNAIIKLRLEPLFALSLISIACAVVTLPLAVFVPPPPAEAWPYVAASLVLHLVYYVALGEAYRHGDLSLVYPLARGSAPLLTAAAATAWLGEQLGPIGWAGVGTLATAVLMFSLRGGRDPTTFAGRTVGFALLTAASISAYTVVDGTGARVAGSASTYIVWLLLLDGLMMLLFGLWRAGTRLFAHFIENWASMLGGGMLSAAGYGIVIWAMTVAPIALVAALRETGVLFAALIGIVFLGEPVRLLRVVAAMMAVAGALLIRFR
jgi:drug/metabolite transporter (DMT)-like permease